LFGDRVLTGEEGYEEGDRGGRGEMRGGRPL